MQRTSADTFRGENESGRFIEARVNNTRPGESPRIEVIDNLRVDGVSLSDRIYGKLIGRNANDLLTPDQIESNLRIPVKLTPEAVDRLPSGRVDELLPDGTRIRGYAYRADQFEKYTNKLPQILKDKIKFDSDVSQYFRSQETSVIFFGDTTKVADFAAEQYQSHTGFGHMLLHGGVHNVIRKEWFPNQGWARFFSGSGLPQIRIVHPHLTDIYRHETKGFVLFHYDEGENVRLDGFGRHAVEYVRSLFRKRSPS